MSRITVISQMQHQASGVNLSASQTYEANENLLTSIIEDVLSSPVTSVEYGDILTPKYVQLRLISGGDAEISLDGGANWPLRLSGVDDSTLLRLNNALSAEISSVQANAADVDGSLSGLYFDAQDTDGPVRAYFDVPARAEVSEITAVADVSGSLDGAGFILYDSAGSVGVWFDHGDTGTAAPADVAAAARQIEITGVADDDTADDVAAAIQAALDADGAFSASVLGSVVTITDAATGDRTDVADSVNVASGFTFAVNTQGIDDVVVPAAPVGGRLLTIALTAGATLAQIAQAVDDAFQADANFSASNNGVDTVLIEDVHIGTRPNIADGTTGFVFATTQNGDSPLDIQIRAVSTAAEVMVTVTPT